MAGLHTAKGRVDFRGDLLKQNVSLVFDEVKQIVFTYTVATKIYFTGVLSI